MKLHMLMLADYASIDGATQKLNILGVFSKIFATQIPVTHRRMVIVAKIIADIGDSAEANNLTVSLADEDGMKLLELKTAFVIPSPQNGHRPDFDVVWEINELEFPHEGYYQLTVSVNEQELGATSIELIKIK